jgi:acyl carrier protein
MIDVQVVKDCAAKLKLLNANGQLRRIDSMALIDLVIELEYVAKVVIPPTSIGIEHFESLESIVKLLEQLQAPASEAVAKR